MTKDLAGLKRRGGRVSPLAFSLMEITIALGIFAFAMVGILGLLPSAVTSARESLDMATATQMANRIAAAYNKKEWGTLTTGETESYFNDLGDNVSETDSGVVYKAIVDVGEMEDSDNLKRIAVRILRKSASDPRSGWTFCYLISKNAGEPNQEEG